MAQSKIYVYSNDNYNLNFTPPDDFTDKLIDLAKSRTGDDGSHTCVIPYDVNLAEKNYNHIFVSYWVGKSETEQRTFTVEYVVKYYNLYEEEDEDEEHYKYNLEIKSINIYKIQYDTIQYDTIKCNVDKVNEIFLFYYFTKNKNDNLDSYNHLILDLDIIVDSNDKDFIYENEYYNYSPNRTRRGIHAIVVSSDDPPQDDTSDVIESGDED